MKVDVDSTRSPAELLRAARRLHRLRAMRSEAGAVKPWLVPVLFVPGIGGTRLELRQATSWSRQESHNQDLWDPDDVTANADLYGWIGEACAGEAACAAGLARAEWSLELSRRWCQPAQVLRTHPLTERLRLMSRLVGIDGTALLPGLREHLLVRYDSLCEQGWTALPSSYWWLAERLALTTDPQLRWTAHAHAWDWSRSAADAAPALATHIAGLLEQAIGNGPQSEWRRPARPTLIIVAENSGVDLVRAAMTAATLPENLLAFYTVDDVNAEAIGGSVDWFAALCNDANAASPQTRRLLSHGWREWQGVLQAARTPRLAVNAVLPGSMALLPSAAPVGWLHAGAPRSVMVDPLRMLLAGTTWNASSHEPSVQPMIGRPLLDIESDWREAAQAALPAPTLAQQPAGFETIACRLEADLPYARLIMRFKTAAPSNDQAERHADDSQRWHFDRMPNAYTLAAQDEPIEGVTLTCSSATGLCDAILHDITQRVLRDPPTPFGQSFSRLGRRLLLGESESTQATTLAAVPSRNPSRHTMHISNRHSKEIT